MKHECGAETQTNVTRSNGAINISRSRVVIGLFDDQSQYWALIYIFIARFDRVTPVLQRRNLEGHNFRL